MKQYLEKHKKKKFQKKKEVERIDPEQEQIFLDKSRRIADKIERLVINKQ